MPGGGVGSCQVYVVMVVVHHYFFVGAGPVGEATGVEEELLQVMAVGFRERADDVRRW